MNNRDRLIDLMLEKKLERREIADLLSVKRDEVDHWLLPTEADYGTQVPDMAIELLELKLRAQADEPANHQADD
jgi:hypothetical protein